MYLILFLLSLVYFYFNRNALKYVIYNIIKFYTFIEVNGFVYIQRIRNYLNRGLKINYVYYYTNNQMIQIDKNKRNKYIEKIDNSDCMYIVYRFNSCKYIDIVSSSNKSHYEILDSLKYINNEYYKGLVCACSITISDENIVIYDEIDITDILISLLHNSINSKLSIEHIKHYMFNELNIEDNYSFVMTLIDRDCCLHQLNTSNFINIDFILDDLTIKIE